MFVAAQVRLWRDKEGCLALLKPLTQDGDALVDHQHQHEAAHHCATDCVNCLAGDQLLVMLPCAYRPVHRVFIVYIGINWLPR